MGGNRGGRRQKIPVMSAKEPEELLREARMVPDRKLGWGSSYPPAILRAAEVLKRKGLSWIEITKWFEDNGVTGLTTNKISSAVYKWGKTDDYIAFAAEEDKEGELAKVANAGQAT